jgi:hypothetical protein
MERLIKRKAEMDLVSHKSNFKAQAAALVQSIEDQRLAINRVREQRCTLKQSLEYANMFSHEGLLIYFSQRFVFGMNV